jgi:lipid-binding SYLF domain-containing protein
LFPRRSILAAALVVLASGCTTSMSTTRAVTPSDAAGLGPLTAEERRDIRNGYDDTMRRLDDTTPGAGALIDKAVGVLVFPQVISGGLVVGAELGNGVLRVNKNFGGYYRMATGTLGLQIGAQSRSLVFLFMTQESLDNFRRSNGWSVGADASVAVLKVGANGAIDVNVAQAPTIAFVMTNSGLMANLTFKGTRITPIQ